MSSSKRYASMIILFAIVAVATAASFMDYGENDQNESPIDMIRELYGLPLRHASLDDNNNNNNFGDGPMGHLMIRKSQRSPSLRLRFGRSGRGASATLPRPWSGMTAFNDN